MNVPEPCHKRTIRSFKRATSKPRKSLFIQRNTRSTKRSEFRAKGRLLSGDEMTTILLLDNFLILLSLNFIKHLSMQQYNFKFTQQDKICYGCTRAIELILAINYWCLLLVPPTRHYIQKFNIRLGLSKQLRIIHKHLFLIPLFVACQSPAEKLFNNFSRKFNILILLL